MGRIERLQSATTEHERDIAITLMDRERRINGIPEKLAEHVQEDAHRFATARGAWIAGSTLISIFAGVLAWVLLEYYAMLKDEAARNAIQNDRILLNTRIIQELEKNNDDLQNRLRVLEREVGLRRGSQ